LALHRLLTEADIAEPLPLPLAVELPDVGARILRTARALGLTARAAGAPVRASTKTKARPAAAAKTARSSTEAHVLGWPDPPTPGAITRTETKGGATRAGKR
ncbi:hypothetical protein L6R52_16990, partial [Myxococcota bacterium]|nr:hypothetical protein [Myxococcota bacterium]